MILFLVVSEKREYIMTKTQFFHLHVTEKWIIESNGRTLFYNFFSVVIIL